MDLLFDETEQIKLNIIQLITSVAEHPEGRKKAKASLPRLKELKNDPGNEFLVPYIEFAIEIITWTP